MAGFEKIRMEFEIACSAKVLYDRISTPEGLSEWFADNVNATNLNEYIFIWDGNEQHAKIIGKKFSKYIRFQWNDFPEDTYFEFRIQLDELTNDVALVIIDFVEEDEIEETKMLWASQVDVLKKQLGI